MGCSDTYSASNSSLSFLKIHLSLSQAKYVDDLLLASDEVDCVNGDSIELTTIRASIDKVKRELTKDVREKQLFIAASYAKASISGDGAPEAIFAINRIVKQRKERQ